uniref:B-cell receptor CD22 n=1 Tax=Esox lucius TaxID=8010 RepID=A0AAY5KHK1_ESOLU
PGVRTSSLMVVLGQNGLGVTYSAQSICGLKGSTVEMSCSYTFPSGTVKSTLWFSKGPDDNPVNLTVDPDYTGRVTYRNNKNNNNTLIITDLRETDSAEYKFRFITVKPGNQWTGTPGVKLSVTDLQVDVTPATVTEGQNVTLTCITSCPLTDNPTYIWYKKTVTSPKASGRRYSISNITSEDSGEYYCEAQNKYGRLTASTVSVDVQCKYISATSNIFVSVSPSGEIMEGSSVTLTCSSDANPPMDKYTWYKKTVTSPIASGQSYLITNITSEDSGEYYCVATNVIGNRSSDLICLMFLICTAPGTIKRPLHLFFSFTKTSKRKVLDEEQKHSISNFHNIIQPSVFITDTNETVLTSPSPLHTVNQAAYFPAFRCYAILNLQMCSSAVNVNNQIPLLYMFLTHCYCIPTQCGFC